MPRRRYYKRTANKDKYSIEHTIVRTNPTSEWNEIAGSGSIATSYQVYHNIVPPTDLEGMRKVKHLTITASNMSSSTNPVYYVLAYVPQGYNPQNINLPIASSNISTYQANQYVLSSGWLDFDGGPLRIRTNLSRNLNSGDSISLVLATYNAAVNNYYVFDVTYAITLQ